MRSRLFLYCLGFLLVCQGAWAHLGNKFVFFEGDSGAYRVRVSVRPPEVVPGLAQINVRVLKGEVTQIGVLPVKWDAGREGAPPPDICQPVKGETNLYSAQLWFMDMGSYSVFVDLDGEAGKATAIVPLNSISTKRLEMPKWMATAFMITGGVLIILLVTIVNAAVREGVLKPGEVPNVKRVRRGQLAMAVAAVLMTSGLVKGKNWWDQVDHDFRTKRLFKPMVVKAEVVETEQKLKLDLASVRDDFRDRTDLVADHGKVMHTFLIKEGNSAFAHLHPGREKHDLFSSNLPELPEGSYTLFADITHASGLTQTLTSKINVPKNQMGQGRKSDEDDAHWKVSEAILGDAAQLPNSLTATWHQTKETIVQDAEVGLTFDIHAADGQPAPIEPYMGMWAHLIVASEDHEVFTHLHPGGTVSMAAQDMFEQRERANSKSPRSMDVICGRPERELVFPYSFAKPGKYRMWLQTRCLGEIITAAFDVNVVPAAL